MYMYRYILIKRERNDHLLWILLTRSVAFYKNNAIVGICMLCHFSSFALYWIVNQPLVQSLSSTSSFSKNLSSSTVSSSSIFKVDSGAGNLNQISKNNIVLSSWIGVNDIAWGSIGELQEESIGTQHKMSRRSTCSPAVVRMSLIVVGICLVGYTVRPPFYWHFRHNVRMQSSCPPCVCDCSESAISLPLGLANSSFDDCDSPDPNLNEEMHKTINDLFSEELQLNEEVAKDREDHAAAAILEAKKTSSQYQKEAEKCTVGVQTCEKAREMVEVALREEAKVSAMWEKRARDRGWI